ncbi:hypothetical protein; putative exported protein [Herminiimonas arsenicoxydans]|uniref:Uncharacterized protein n=1 Tax=Herminiimonas arsenicoxydans TaxID=204773 RepID=A4G2H0_HERAR|nr:hypothetical protein; putative exported protein [Herminiimonas arsenicoxydans]
MRQLTSRAHFVAAFFMLFLLGTTAAFSKVVTPSAKESIPPLLTVGIFRIESERSYKLSLQMALGILGDQVKRERDRSIASILKMRQDLNGLPDKSTKTTRALTRANIALTDQMDGLPKLNASNASVMYDVNEDLLNKLNTLAFSLESDTNDTNSRVVALALRQASLAQRMAKIVLLRSLDKSMTSKQGLQVDLTQSKIEFQNGLNLLAEEAGSDRLLSSRVELARQQWIFYQTALTSAGTNQTELRNIATTSDRIAEQMIEIVHISYALPLDSLTSARWK